MQQTVTVAWRLVALVAVVLAIAIALIVVLLVRSRAKKQARGFPVEPRE